MNEATLDSEALDAAIFHPQFDEFSGHFVLYGARGSTPTPGGPFVRHGGHTSCMAFFFDEEVVIFDAGSGIRDLGCDLVKMGPRKIHLFITHTHWDHIQGFPFFQPAYTPGFEICIYGSRSFGKDLRSVFQGQLDQEYFPVSMEDMSARLEFLELPDDHVDIGRARVTWQVVHHPGTTVGYKLDLDGRKLVWIPDNEFLKGHLGDPNTLDVESMRDYAEVIDFLTGINVLIHEAQYTSEEYPAKIGWGHSSVPNACAMIKEAGVRRWIVTHHDPSHDDQFLEHKLVNTRQILHHLGHRCLVRYGYDGMKEYL